MIKRLLEKCFVRREACQIKMKAQRRKLDTVGGLPVKEEEAGVLTRGQKEE